MKVVAETLGVARSNLHDRLKGTTKPRRRYHKAQDAALLPLITALVTARPTYGSRRITAVLRHELQISRPTVQRYMRQMDIAGICPGPNLSKRNAEHKLYPYLLRNVRITCPNHVWGIDST